MSVKSYRAAHILVSAKFEAEDILRKLNEGAEFAILAKKFSSCSSAANGGDLGEIKITKADPEFEEAVLALKPNEIGKSAVRTKFGYHIIKRL